MKLVVPNIAGSTINSSNGVLPYRSSATAFSNSPLSTDGTDVTNTGLFKLSNNKAYQGALLAGTQIDLIKVNTSDQVSVAAGGQNAVFGGNVIASGIGQFSNYVSAVDYYMSGNSGRVIFGGSGDVAIGRNAAGIIEINNATLGTYRWLRKAGEYRVSAQFDKTNATLANVTGLVSDTLVAGRTYRFVATLFVDCDAVGGHKYAMAGTVTATSVIYQVNSINNGTNAFRINSRQTALGGSVGEAVGTAYYTRIEGTITVNAAGTLAVQFSQNSANGTSSILVGSTLTVEDIN